MTSKQAKQERKTQEESKKMRLEKDVKTLKKTLLKESSNATWKGEPKKCRNISKKELQNGYQNDQKSFKNWIQNASTFLIKNC